MVEELPTLEFGRRRGFHFGILLISSLFLVGYTTAQLPANFQVGVTECSTDIHYTKTVKDILTFSRGFVRLLELALLLVFKSRY